MKEVKNSSFKLVQIHKKIDEQKKGYAVPAQCLRHCPC